MGPEYVLKLTEHNGNYFFGIYDPKIARVKSLSSGLFPKKHLNLGYIMIKFSLKSLEEREIKKIQIVSDFLLNPSEKEINHKRLQGFQKKLSKEVKNIEFLV